MITGEQIAALQQALLSAFPSRQKLKEMVRIRLGQNVEQIAGGEDLAAVVFNLIEWADSNGKVEDLLIAGFQHNQGNEKVRRVFAQRFGFSSNQTRTRPSMLDDFDLDDQINQCLNILWRKNGLVGFAVPYAFDASDAFVQNLCERLKYELGGEDYVRLMKPLIIDPIRGDVSWSILTIKKRCLPALKKRDVLLRIKVSKEEMVNRFWQSLRHGVEGRKLQNRLIVVVVTDPGCILPEEVIPLTPPHFQVAHVHRWVRKVVTHFDWPEAIFQIMTTHIIAECSHENELLVYWVYDYLEAVQELLKQNPTAEKFKIELNKL